MTESEMTERSLSALYRADLRRSPAGVGAEDLHALGGNGAIDSEMLERLARSPDASSMYAIANALAPWSVTVAEDLRRARSIAGGSASRAPHWGWISLAAAASLAICVVGLGQREQTDATMQVAVQPSVTSQTAQAPDILFADPDNAMLAAAPAPTSDSIFTDSLDTSPSPRES